MKKIRLIRWFKNVSLAKKLYFVMGIMAALIGVELFALNFTIHTLSATRALVGGEGLWSKAEKDATSSLQKYRFTYDEQDYVHYLDMLSVPLGDHRARLALSAGATDMKSIREGFIQGRIHSDDIDGIVNLLTRFHGNSYIERAVTYWTRGDSMITVLQTSGTKLHEQILSGSASPQEIKATSDEIQNLNKKITVLEDDFSFTLGEGSRWMEHLILKLLLAIAITVEFTGLFLSISVSRAITKGINEIVAVAKKVASGDFTNRAKIFSKDEIGFLANSVNSMVGNLEKKIVEERKAEESLHNQKELFMANMSHEIRTPVTGIMGFTELFSETDLSEKQREYLEGIKSSSEHLLTIINEILDLSKINAGKVAFEKNPFNLQTVIKNIASTIIMRANRKDISFTYSIDNNVPEKYVGDSVRLSQIIWNIAGNAVKFTERGEVSLNVSLQKEDADTAMLLFTVADTGIGIPEDRLAKIFEAFTQVDPNISRKHEGTGLGLTIASKLVELQGGNISVESIVGKGSTFKFTINYNKYFPPLKLPASKTPELAAENYFDFENIHILLAEDNKVNQKVCNKILTNRGALVDIADNGKIAVELALAKDYDIILMDIQMPEMDGYEAARVIRANMPKPKSDTPILALTALAMNGEGEKCFAAGMNGYLSKPFKAGQLCEKIVNLVNHKTAASTNVG
jgi:two-component system, sensor histidine kinase